MLFCMMFKVMTMLISFGFFYSNLIGKIIDVVLGIASLLFETGNVTLDAFNSENLIIYANEEFISKVNIVKRVVESLDFRI